MAAAAILILKISIFGHVTVTVKLHWTDSEFDRTYFLFINILIFAVL